MKFKEIAVLAFLCLPLSILAFGDAEVENIAPVQHTDELNDQEKKTFEEQLKEKAQNTHYKDQTQSFRDTRINNYISRSKSLDNDIKRHMTDNSKMNDLTKEKLESLKKRLQQKIDKEQGLFASKGLRDELQGLLNKANEIQPKKINVKPKSLEDAQKQLENVQQNIDDYSKQIRTTNQRIQEIDAELEPLTEEETDDTEYSLYDEKDTQEQPKELSPEEIKERTKLEDEKSMLEDNYQYYTPLLEEQEKYKKDIEDYINSQPLQDRMNLAENQLKTLEAQPSLNTEEAIQKRIADYRKKFQKKVIEPSSKKEKPVSNESTSIDDDENKNLSSNEDDIKLLTKINLEKEYSNSNNETLQTELKKTTTLLQETRYKFNKTEILELQTKEEWLKQKIEELKQLSNNNKLK